MSDAEAEKGRSTPTTLVNRPVRFANTGPLGLISFAATTLILSLYNVNTRHITIPNVIVGPGLATGGLGQILAGIGDYFVGNIFGATAFTLFGGFWISFSVIFIPNSGVGAAYATTPEAASQFHNAVGIYLMIWFVITFILWIGTLRSTVALSAVFFFLWVTFILLAAGEFTQHNGVTVAGGALGIVTALSAFYAAATQLYIPAYTPVYLPAIPLPKPDSLE